MKIQCCIFVLFQTNATTSQYRGVTFFFTHGTICFMIAIIMTFLSMCGHAAMSLPFEEMKIHNATSTKGTVVHKRPSRMHVTQNSHKLFSEDTQTPPSNSSTDSGYMSSHSTPTPNDVTILTGDDKELKMEAFKESDNSLNHPRMKIFVKKMSKKSASNCAISPMIAYKTSHKA